jgi:hypothetical protein
MEPAIATRSGRQRMGTMEQQEISTMVKASKLAIAMAVVAPLSAAAVSEASAAPVSTNAISVKALAPRTTVNVQYWYAGQPYYFDYYSPYVSRPQYRYQGYTYWYPNYYGY